MIQHLDPRSRAFYIAATKALTEQSITSDALDELLTTWKRSRILIDPDVNDLMEHVEKMTASGAIRIKAV